VEVGGGNHIERKTYDMHAGDRVGVVCKVFNLKALHVPSRMLDDWLDSGWEGGSFYQAICHIVNMSRGRRGRFNCRGF